jgi:hypothetical protein
MGYLGCSYNCDGRSAATAFPKCKIARNTDPLRGDIASNSDPF